ncbi:MAG: FAD-dependent monooxygenase [Polyangiales bacterium]
MAIEQFDAIVVGAGPAGNAAALVMARAGLNVLQLERGEYPGSKNVQGAILYSDSLEKLIPEFREDAPLERHIIEQRIWMMDDKSHIGMHYRSESFNEARPNRYTILRAQFDKWFSKQVKAAGATVLCETTVTGLLRDRAGRVVGVQTDRKNGEVYADVVVLADGVNGLVGQRAGLRPELQPDQVAVAVKEMHFLPQEVIESRFNLHDREGAVIEAMGTVTAGLVGKAFLYTNLESISLGVGCLVSDFIDGDQTPNSILERLKAHPSVKSLLEGSEAKEYAAHLIPEGGYYAVPQLFGDGWVVVGDSAHMINNMHIEGSNIAMTSGQIAAETIIGIKQKKGKCTAQELSAYKKAIDDSWVMKDLKKYRKLPDFMHHNKHFLSLYPSILGQAAENWFRVDAVDKRSKEKQIMQAFRDHRGITGLIGDAFKMMRMWR